MTEEEYYGNIYPTMKCVQERLLNLINNYNKNSSNDSDTHQIVYYCSRIKSPESTINKLTGRGLSTDANTALSMLYDTIGIRIVCSFTDNIYQIYEWIKTLPQLRVIEVKDYVAYPKPNGYRSFHLLLQYSDEDGLCLPVEIQIRTIAMDFWASLEHKLKYKHEVSHREIIQDELKRCADETASIDISMQTIRDILKEE